MRKISPKQRETLKCLIDYNQKHGYFPSVRELCAAMNIASTNTIQVHLRGLTKKGYLQREGSQARALRLTDKAYQECGEPQRATARRQTSAAGSSRKSLESLFPEGGSALLSGLGIPLLGSVPAGPLTEAIENNEGEIDLADILAIDDQTFGLMACGDSMINRGIHDGDLLIVRNQPDAESGEIVVALLDGDTTVKTLIKRTDGITLQPASEHFEPIHIPLEYDDFRICGKVVGIIRRMT